MKTKKLFLTWLLTLMLLGMFSPFLSQTPFNVPLVYAASEPSDGDAWTENDNATYVWTISPSYKDTIEFTTEEAQVGSYTLKVNHTSATSYMAFQLDLGSQTNFSSYDFMEFQFKFVSPNAEELTIYCGEIGAFTGDRWVISALSLTNNTWRTINIPLVAFRINSGTPSWTIIRYFGFMSSSLGSADGSTIYIDGLHFGTYDNPTVTNSLNDLAIPNFYAYYPKFTEKTVTNGATSYTSLYEFQNLTSASEISSNIESEVLAHVILALTIAYNETQDSTLLSKIETYANWLLQFQNATNGGFHDDFNDGTDTFQDQETSTHNGWVLTALSYLYDITSNSTYKTAADNLRGFLTDILWDNTNKWYDNYYKPSTGVVTDHVVWNAMSCGAIVSGLSSYYRFVSTNATVKTQVDETLSKMSTLTYGGINNTYSAGAPFEDTLYQRWGMFESYKAYNNLTYLGWLDNHWEHLKNNYKLTSNGTMLRFPSYFHEHSSQYLEGWGIAINQLLTMLLYQEAPSTTKQLLYEKTMLDYVETVRTEGSGLDNYAIARFRYSGTQDDRTYVPSQAFLYASLILYKYNIDGTTTPFIVRTDKTITVSSYSGNILTFTVSATGTSTTLIYCGENGNPSSVSGHSSISYDSSTAILTIIVSHSSSQEVIVSWETVSTILTDAVIAVSQLTAITLILGIFYLGVQYDGESWKRRLYLIIASLLLLIIVLVLAALPVMQGG